MVCINDFTQILLHMLSYKRTKIPLFALAMMLFYLKPWQKYDWAGFQMFFSQKLFFNVN